MKQKHLQEEGRGYSSTNHNKNTVRVNNNFQLTINVGDSLNLLALIAAGIVVIRNFSKKNKAKKANM